MLQNQKGLGLVEAVAAVGIVGTAIVALVLALAAGSIAVRELDRQVIAQRLVRTQMEYIKGYSYDAEGNSYSAIEGPEGYTISIKVDSTIYTDNDIQKIIVTVSHGSEEILTVADYKVNR